MEDKKVHTNENFEIKEWRKRLRFLADIIFGTAMTVMILNIEMPDIGHITSTSDMASFLLNQLSKMWVFFICFIVISVIG